MPLSTLVHPYQSLSTHAALHIPPPGPHHGRPKAPPRPPRLRLPDTVHPAQLVQGKIRRPIAPVLSFVEAQYPIAVAMVSV